MQTKTLLFVPCDRKVGYSRASQIQAVAGATFVGEGIVRGALFLAANETGESSALVPLFVPNFHADVKLDVRGEVWEVSEILLDMLAGLDSVRTLRVHRVCFGVPIILADGKVASGACIALHHEEDFSDLALCGDGTFYGLPEIEYRKDYRSRAREIYSSPESREWLPATITAGEAEILIPDDGSAIRDDDGFLWVPALVKVPEVAPLDSFAGVTLAEVYKGDEPLPQWNAAEMLTREGIA